MNEAVKYKNRTAGPIALDLQSIGTTVSVEGKGTVWLWPGDIVLPRVANAIANGRLIPWADGEAPPESPEDYIQRTNALQVTQRIKNRSGRIPQKKSFSSALLEGVQAEKDQASTTLSVYGGVGSANQVVVAKHKVFTPDDDVRDFIQEQQRNVSTADSESAGGGSRPKKARGSVFHKPNS